VKARNILVQYDYDSPLVSVTQEFPWANYEQDNVGFISSILIKRLVIAGIW
jgi:hypothetical protein